MSRLFVIMSNRRIARPKGHEHDDLLRPLEIDYDDDRSMPFSDEMGALAMPFSVAGAVAEVIDFGMIGGLNPM